MDEDEFEVEEAAPALKLHLVDLPMTFFSALADLARAFVSIFDNASRLFAMHSNYRTKIDYMRDETIRDIESLPVVEDGE